MDLEALIRDLVENQGLTEDEATLIAAARLKARRTAIAKSESAVAKRGYGRNAHDGGETPEEALERWREQEMSDPQGVYSGGASAGGVFGDGAILMSDYDPIAVSRTVQMQAQVANAQTNMRMLQLLERMQAQLPPAQEREPEPEPRRFGGFNKFLGRKKDR